MNGPPAVAGVEGEFAGRVGGFRIDARFALLPTGVTALSGPSGSGKSTLMRCMAGLARLPGRLVVDGEVWQDERTFRPPHRRPVGVVFQEAGLLPHLSVRRNLLYGARRASANPTAGLQDTIDLLGLGALLDRSPTKLSGGERQRVALGRALLSKPRLLLLDEPLSSLDAQSKAEILPYLERLHRSLALPTLYISHDAGEIARLADRVLYMREGRILPALDRTAEEQAAFDAARRRLDVMSVAEREAMALAAIEAGLKPSEQLSRQSDST
jgi:molybdate transport system ATP-binding protein